MGTATIRLMSPKRKKPGKNPWPDRLRELREKLDMLPTEICLYVQTTPRSWQYWERGQRWPEGPTAMLLLDFCADPHGFIKRHPLS